VKIEEEVVDDGKKDKGVVDEDWRGSRWWRLKRRALLMKSEDWRLKIEEDVVNDGKKRERQRAVDEESKTKD